MEVNDVAETVFYLAQAEQELEQAVEHSVTETHKATEGAHGEGGHGSSPMKAEPNLWIWTVIAFAIVFGILSKFAFPRITAMIDERNNKIEGDIKHAELTREEAEQMLAQYKGQLAEARTEAKKIIDEGKQLGETLRKEAMAKATEEANQLIRRAQEEIGRQTEKAIKELQGQIADISIQVASKVIQKSLDKEEHNNLIKQYISEVGRLYEG
jgi:F-type H+-transporting ATPase subunit b